MIATLSFAEDTEYLQKGVNSNRTHRILKSQQKIMRKRTGDALMFKGRKSDNGQEMAPTKAAVTFKRVPSKDIKVGAPSGIIHTTTNKEEKCQLCRGQQFLPNDDLELLEKPCSFWQNREVDVNHCHQIQSTYGSACGCPDSPRPRCDVCPDGDYIWKQNLNFNGFVDDYCVRMVHKLSRETEDYCDVAKEKVARMCCTSSCSAKLTNKNQVNKSLIKARKSPKGLKAEMIQLKGTRLRTQKPKAERSTKTAKTNTMFRIRTTSKSKAFQNRESNSMEETFTAPSDNEEDTGGEEVYYYYDDM